MIQEIYKNIYRNTIRLPHTPLKILNSYIITDDNRALIIDSGFNCKESYDDFFTGINSLGIDINNIDLFITHLHADHSGLAAQFQKKSTGKIYASLIDSQFISSMVDGSFTDLFRKSLALFGINESDDFFNSHPAITYSPDSRIDFTILKHGDRLTIGDYNLDVIFVPGHTPDHISLYDKTNKIYFSGDHIISSISPNISYWGDEYDDMLGKYINSLDAIYKLDIDYVFSSHRDIITNHKKRIDEIKLHHKERLDEIVEIIKLHGKKLSVLEIASKMHWDYRAVNFDAFPNAQKWFACSEAMAHLEYLRLSSKLKCSEVNSVRYYFL